MPRHIKGVNMADDPPNGVTVEELLPALIELASIQHDLVAAMSPPRPKIDTAAKTALYGKPAEVSLQDISKLRERTREVLVWLLARAKGQS
jgi:hypothetical protein